ncbi:UDP-N-acetylglucosamine 4,6-dehydratase family protein [Fontivita pretiosa]|uniref:UDP-N-acetylglucosamine 4,6-dehydratase family protein n=1 Tax=Fontivita pretiosa TaxID=2989684 RepID=UPI003D16B237
MLRQIFRTIVGQIQLNRARSAAAPRDNCALEIAELLRRKPVNLDTPEIQRFLAGKVVLVTGAGGSIGSEICRQTMKFCPGRLILLDRAENALFEIDRELRDRWVGAEIVPVVADICDANRIDRVFRALRPQVVFHCAAHKHVPMMELHPGEAVKNNVFGTKIVADAALEHGVGAFVMVSTDKAVNPTSVMGATKRIAELYVQSLNSGQRPVVGAQGPSTEQRPVSLEHRCRFVAVRFGNVLGSSGSVLPIFRRQIEAGGPVTVTHPDMKRYFMTIPEASQLVMQAGAIGRGGEIFVLDMGQPVRILDLAVEMIRRAGLRPGRDIQIRFTGMRPGEKLYEELACDDEQTVATSHGKIRIWQLPRASRQQVGRMLQLLQSVIDAPRAQVIQTLMHCVPEYKPAGGDICDAVFSADEAEPLQTDDQASQLRVLARLSASRAA